MRLIPANEDECRMLGKADGVQSLTVKPLNIDPARRRIPAKSSDEGVHLWVILSAGFPFIAERAVISPALESGLVKHSNLTGGRDACCGGEIWFDPAEMDLVYVNGCSGRYGPQTPEELEDVVAVVTSLGYRAKSFGWDYEAAMPARVLR